jgi:hypothetical protein
VVRSSAASDVYKRQGFWSSAVSWRRENGSNFRLRRGG